jgi:hypothetical protein
MCLGRRLDSDGRAGHRCSIGGSGWCLSDFDVTPELVAKRCAISRLETPVADALSFTSRSLHGHSEGELLSWEDLTTNNVALASLSDVRSGSDTSVVNVEHVVTTNEADTTSGGPREWSRVAEGPRLDETSVRSNDGTVRNTVGDEDSFKQMDRSLGLESRRDRLGDRGLLLDLLLVQHLRFRRRIGQDVSDSLDRGSSVDRLPAARHDRSVHVASRVAVAKLANSMLSLTLG